MKKLEKLKELILEFYNRTEPLQRTKTDSNARKMFYLLGREMTGLSYRELGMWFDGQSHSTVRSAIMSAKKMETEITWFKMDYEYLKKTINLIDSVS